jgi:arylsulfatase I/J
MATLLRAAAAAVVALCCGGCALAAAAAPKPHIVYALIDDYGWANAGWHRATPDPETVTPNLDALVKEGVELDRLYGHKFCGPSRAALQSGRLPIHVTVLDNPLPSVNPKDPDGGFQGIPRNMTGLATKLKSAGYATHFAGTVFLARRPGANGRLREHSQRVMSPHLLLSVPTSLPYFSAPSPPLGKQV